MKTKKFDKKLVLNKKTIADLSGDVMDKVYGGFWSFPIYTECQTDCHHDSLPCCKDQIK